MSYLENEEDFIDNINAIFRLGDKDMEFYRTYLKRLEDMLKSIAVEDEISAEVFRLYPQAIKGMCEAYYFSGNTEELLDTLHIMHQFEKDRRKINIATLNFSGINFNPFEYEDGTA